MLGQEAAEAGGRSCFHTDGRATKGTLAGSQPTSATLGRVTRGRRLAVLPAGANSTASTSTKAQIGLRDRKDLQVAGVETARKLLT